MSTPDTELVHAPRNTLSVLSDSEINRSWRLAEALCNAKTFPDVKSAAQAFAIMLVGHDLGMSPTQALMSVDIIKGRPRVQSVALAGFLKKGGKYDYTVVEKTSELCTIDFYEVGLPVSGKQKKLLGRETFTMEDAVKAELVNKVVKDGEVSYKRRPPASEGWEKYSPNLLYARTISNGVKTYCPDAMGGVPVYTEGDEFTVREALTAGTGSGEAQGLDLGPRVEAVLERAEKLGHAGLSNRAAAEMALGSRSPEAIAAWVVEATRELDELQRGLEGAGDRLEPGDGDELPVDAERVND